MTPKEILALWDRAVAMHREYWSAVDAGKLTEDLREAERLVVTEFLYASQMQMRGPDGVATGL